jgi:hypothetical protein
MRDLNIITVEEGDHYFSDPAFEKPFPLVSRDAIVDVQSKDSIPTRISMHIKVDTVPQVDFDFHRDLQMKDQSQDLDHDTQTVDFVPDDDSCGTLDYSVDTLEEAKIMKVQQALTRVVYGPPASEPSSPIKVERSVTIKDYKMNQAVLAEYDVHAKTNEDECFGIPIGWFTNLFQGLTR